jgi:hypothetical protein
MSTSTEPYPNNPAAPYGYDTETGEALTAEQYAAAHTVTAPTGETEPAVSALELEPNATGYDPTTGAANPPAPADSEFYCPGCGSRYEYRQRCVGMSPEAPHPPIEVVSTAELEGPESGFTPAPPGGIQ